MDERLKRIKEIEKTRNILARERDELQKEIREEKESKILENRNKEIGKYYKLKSKLNRSDSYENLIAFKILKLDEYNPLTTARCLAIIDGYGNGAYKEYGVLNKTLFIWSYDENRMMHNEGDALTIDFFEEISEDEFLKIKNEMLENIENRDIM